MNEPTLADYDAATQAAVDALRDQVRVILDAELAKIGQREGMGAICVPVEAVRLICVEWAREHGLTRR